MTRRAAFFADVRRAGATFGDYLERRGASANTVVQYLSRVRAIETQDDPTAAAVALLTDPSYAPKSKRMMKAAYRAWGKFTGDEALLAALEDLRLPPATRQKAQMPLPPDVYRAIRDEIDRAVYLDDSQRAVLGLMANRGLRRGDVLRMQREEITSALKQPVLSYLAKGSKRLEIGVLKSFRPYLEILASKRNWRVVNELVSVSQSGAEKAIPAALRRVASAIDLGEDVVVDDVRPHILRRTYAVMYYEACGRDPNKLMHHMGWSNIATAMGYVDFVKRDELDAVAEKMMER